MPIRDYPFICFTKETRPRMLLPIRITNPDTEKTLDTFGLIQTSTDRCVVPAEYASILGHNLTRGTTRKVSTGNGTSIAYSHTCTISIFDLKALENKTLNAVYEIERTHIEFVPNLSHVILGVENFLSRFILAVDYPNQVFSIRKPSENSTLRTLLERYQTTRDIR